MKWRRAFVIKKMRGRDFSSLQRTCGSVVYMFDENISEFDLPEKLDEISAFLEGFNSAQDVLVISGPVSLCSIAITILSQKYSSIILAVYQEGKYEFFEMLFSPEEQPRLERLKEAS